MTKPPIKIDERYLPEPFRTYWSTNNRPSRNWKFYILDKELYIEDEYEDGLYSQFLFHWTTTNCCGVSNFMSQNKIIPTTKPHILCFCGNNKFTLRYGVYEMNAKCSECKIEHTVYDG